MKIINIAMRDIKTTLLKGVALPAVCTVALFLTCGAPKAVAADFANEDLHYEIVYHWGLIWKHAASATLSLRNAGTVYNTALTAKTVSWADKFYPVRDTLRCTIAKERLRPLKYVKSSHEGNYEETDEVVYSYSDGTTFGHCTRTRPGEQPEKQELSTKGAAYDMLSVFYFLRKLNFAGMRESTVYTSTVFSGRKKETVSVRLVGVESIKLRDKSVHKAFHVKFTFTQDGSTKSSDDIDTWISADNRRIPLMLRGKLPVGEVRVYYTSK